MFILGFIAIAGHFLLGYHWIFKPTYNIIQTLKLSNGKENTPLFTQEKSAFIFLPLIGYTAFFALREFDNSLGFDILPLFILVQTLSFGLYFYSRSKIQPRSMLEVVLTPSLLVFGILTCIVLIVKLFIYFLICITLGWIFVILPLCMMAYYALFQVIAFQITELAKILKFTKNNFNPNSESKFPLGFRFIYFGQLYLVSQLLTFAVLCVLLTMVYRYVGFGIFHFNLEAILRGPANFIF